MERTGLHRKKKIRVIPIQAYRKKVLGWCSSVPWLNYTPGQMTKMHGSSPGELSEELVMQEKRKKVWRMNCDVGEASEGVGE